MTTRPSTVWMPAWIASALGVLGAWFLLWRFTRTLSRVALPAAWTVLRVVPLTGDVFAVARFVLFWVILAVGCLALWRARFGLTSKRRAGRTSS